MWLSSLHKEWTGNYKCTCRERPHVRAVVLDRWSLVTCKINMICKGCAIQKAKFWVLECKNRDRYINTGFVVKKMPEESYQEFTGRAQSMSASPRQLVFVNTVNPCPYHAAWNLGVFFSIFLLCSCLVAWITQSGSKWNQYCYYQNQISMMEENCWCIIE